jgi:hypothetical protein
MLTTLHHHQAKKNCLQEGGDAIEEGIILLKWTSISWDLEFFFLVTASFSTVVGISVLICFYKFLSSFPLWLFFWPSMWICVCEHRCTHTRRLCCTRISLPTICTMLLYLLYNAPLCFIYISCPSSGTYNCDRLVQRIWQLVIDK